MFARVDESAGTCTVCTPVKNGDHPEQFGLSEGTQRGDRTEIVVDAIGDQPGADPDRQSLRATPRWGVGVAAELAAAR